MEEIEIIVYNETNIEIINICVLIIFIECEFYKFYKYIYDRTFLRNLNLFIIRKVQTIFSSRSPIFR